ncbi:AbiH family protein [Bacteroides sp. GD17]|jgi:hypothetical protein|uniref:AbiH family protein n=1 Tax=Bacteroides sp. GD17 TaxID=3139826 RepID=UPI00204FFDEB|nr:AbiH family protein [uncultured Bacteroides sp.]DAV67189.1 MAG TPA: abortive infection protein [Caudoviricetes sp.]
MDEDYKLVLVLGNGFDLDLGLKTKYGDFMGSTFFKSSPDYLMDTSPVSGGVNLFKFLEKRLSSDKWIDLEHELATLALVRTKRGPNASFVEEMTFLALHKALCSYLKEIKYDNINEDSVALTLLRILNQYDLWEILSFNYTDLKNLEHYVGEINVPVEYIHGSIKDDSIILGFEDDLEIDSSFCFMIKSFSPYYKSHNVREKLLDANEIIFFGHSLGHTDYHYFEDLFKYQSQAETANQNLIIRIFTFDEESRIETLLQLREMNNKRTDLLYDLCDFEVYRTKDGIDKGKIDKYFGELTKRLQEHAPAYIPGPMFM